MINKILFWFYRTFRPKKCFIGIDRHTGDGKDYSCIVKGYINNKGQYVVMAEKLWQE